MTMNFQRKMENEFNNRFQDVEHENEKKRQDFIVCIDLYVYSQFNEGWFFDFRKQPVRTMIIFAEKSKCHSKIECSRKLANRI